MVDKSAGPESCWLWTRALNGRGYGSLRFELAGQRKTFGAHVVAYVLTNGGPPTSRAANTVILHACDNPTCCNPQHLTFGTTAENHHDAIRKGRRANVPHARGTAVGISKLDEARVLEIRRRYAAGEKQRDLASAFGVTRNAIFMIVSRRTWSHVAHVPWPDAPRVRARGNAPRMAP